MASVKRFYQVCAAFLFLGLIQLSHCVKLRLYCNDDSTLQNYQEVPLSLGETLLASDCYIRSRIDLFFIFGFSNTATGPYVFAVNGAAVEQAQYNVWLLNWGDEATVFNTTTLPVSDATYPGALAAAELVGTQFGNKLVDMTRSGLGFTVANTYVIGLSMGAHLAAQAAQLVKAANLLILWIIGLDPAGPVYSLLRNVTLKSGDAKMVTSIHTDVGGFGINNTNSNVDYFVNYGNYLKPNKSEHVQPGCQPTSNNDQILSFGDSCSHALSWKVLSEGITNSNPSTSLVAASAESYYAWRNGLGDCSKTATIGLELDLTKSGLYFLDTNGAPLYGKGPAGALCT